MRNLELDDDQAATLREILESYLSDLSMEIADTDSMDFREKLKVKKQLLIELIDRL